MAPTSLQLLPRQGSFGGDRGDDDRGDFRNDNGSGGGGGISTWTIVGIVIAVVVIGLVIGLLLLKRFRQRRRAVNAAINLTPTPYKPTANPPSSDPTKYSGTAGGYTASADQNHSLLGHAAAPAVVTWDPAASEQAGSTQDGFGYDNNLHLASNIQRPPSIASFQAPPPRYEEATSNSAPGSSPGLRPQGQGEAASYFNSAASMGEGRGRSRSRDPPAEGSRGRALSVDTRSTNGDRRRSISRFREDGLEDVNVDAKT